MGMDLMRNLLAVLLGGISLIITCGNASIAIRFWVKRRQGSLVPLIGGVCGAVAMLVAPFEQLQRQAWVALVLDLGCVPLLVMSALALIRRHGNDNRGHK
jgi:hypothetical protein